MLVLPVALMRLVTELVPPPTALRARTTGTLMANMLVLSVMRPRQKPMEALTVPARVRLPPLAVT
jgi:hypothetical protein